MRTRRLDSRVLSHLSCPFGEIVSKIGDYLLVHGPQSVSSLSSSLEIPQKKTRESLIILIHHGLVYEYGESNSMVAGRPNSRRSKLYIISRPKIFLNILYPIWANLSEVLYGNDGKSIISYVCIHTVASLESLNKLHGNRIQDTLNILLKEGYLIPMQNRTEEPTRPNKKAKYDDSASFLTINHKRFIKELKSQWLAKWTRCKLGELAGEVMSMILSGCQDDKDVLVRISLNTIKRQLEPVFSNHPPKIICPDTNKSPLDLYIDEICHLSQGFLSKQNSETLVLNPSRAYHEFIQFHSVATFLEKRYNAECAKIFRILSVKQVLDERQIQKLAMMELRETREKLFKMFQDGWIQLQQVPRTADYIPSRSFYLCRYDLKHSIKTLRKFLIKSFINCIERYREERNQNILTQKHLDILGSHAFSMLKWFALIYAE